MRLRFVVDTHDTQNTSWPLWNHRLCGKKAEFPFPLGEDFYFVFWFIPFTGRIPTNNINKLIRNGHFQANDDDLDSIKVKSERSFVFVFISRQGIYTMRADPVTQINNNNNDDNVIFIYKTLHKIHIYFFPFFHSARLVLCVCKRKNENTMVNEKSQYTQYFACAMCVILCWFFIPRRPHTHIN